MIFYIDDINMPVPDSYGSQMPIEYLRFLIDNGGFYDLKKFLLMHIENLTFITSCAPPEGGRNPISPRFFRHFCMI